MTSPAGLAAIRDEIRHVLTYESHKVRKALFEALSQEITIAAAETVRPTFELRKLPLAGNDEGPALGGLVFGYETGLVRPGSGGAVTRRKTPAGSVPKDARGRLRCRADGRWGDDRHRLRTL